jgi:hypothetical protein
MKRRSAIRAMKFVLASHAAASRFRSCCWVAGARVARRPGILLFWRRKPKTSRHRHVGRTTQLSAIWAPQLNLHFGAKVSEKVSRESAPKNFGLNATRSRYPVVLNRYRTTLRVVAAAAPGPRVYRSLKILYQQSRVALAAPGMEPSRQTPATHAPTPLARQVHSSEERRRTRVISRTVRTFATKTLASNTAEYQHYTRELRFRTVVRDALSPSSHSSARAELRLAGPPDLVWRRGPQPSASVMESHTGQIPSTATPSGAHAVRSPEPVVQGATIPAAPFSVHPANHDPAFIDRLTDDVIRKVERRVRIERERRGL